MIFKILSIIFQYLPKRVERNWDSDDVELGREIRILDSKRVLFFSWPKYVCKKIRAQNRILKVIDRYAYDRATKHMVQPTHENPNPKNYFNFSVWRDIQDDALFEATKSTGWSGRQSSHPKRSDFFLCHRLIRFRKLQVETCTHILASLSKQLTTIGKLQSPDFQIQISFSDDYPSVSKLNELERRLELEEISFGEVLNYCFQS
jgi:hypothetical protein